MEEDDGAAPELGPPPPPPPPPPLPSYPEMILEAIDALGNANGSNKTAISGYLKDKYGADLTRDHNSLLTTNLGRMKSAGELVFARNNYFRPDGHDDEEEVKEGEPSATAAAAADNPASPLLPDGYEDPAVAEDFTGLDDFDPGSLFLDNEDDGLLAPNPVLDNDADGVPDPASGVAADEIAVPDPTPGVAADDINVPAPPTGVTSDAAAGPVKRGRGRPPKPKDDVAEDSTGAPAETSLAGPDVVAGAAPPKQGRGRPPKPKDPVGEDSSGVPAETSLGAAPAKRGRGRPPKPKDPVAEASVGATDDAAPAKRGRGRPPKPKDPAAMGTSGEPTAEAPVADTDADAPVKRGRGRPPKPKDPVDETSARATSGMLSPRGRPPKKAKVEEAPIDAPAGSAPGTSAPVKRGRGRPPKVRD